jgi:hypothetical protein
LRGGFRLTELSLTTKIVPMLLTTGGDNRQGCAKRWPNKQPPVELMVVEIHWEARDNGNADNVEQYFFRALAHIRPFEGFVFAITERISSGPMPLSLSAMTAPPRVKQMHLLD